MIKSTKKSKVSKLKRKKNPDIKGSWHDAVTFQDVRYNLAFAAGLDEGSLVGERESTKPQHLARALQQISDSNYKHSLTNYELEIFTPTVKKAMINFAKLLRKSILEISEEYNIDSGTGHLIK